MNRMSTVGLLGALIGMGTGSGVVLGATWTVPSAQTPTLQFALEAPTSPVMDGDTIELTEAGFYLSAYSVGTPNLTIRAAPGNDITIDALGLGSAFTINANNVTLQDLTITGGSATVDGGAVNVPNGSGHDVTIIDCILDDNECAADGGAVFVGSGSILTMSGCTLTNNRGLTGGISDGGAVAVVSTTAFIHDCRFEMNSAARAGGALYSNAGVLNITVCGFESNDALVGGALSCAGGASGLFEDCLFYDNASGANGGAVDCNTSWPDFRRCRFIENNAVGSGGAILVTGETAANLDLENCVLAGNTAGGIGGAWAALSGPDSAITNCTIVGNFATGGGGGLDDSGTGAGTAVRNCIIRGNLPDQFPGIPTNVSRYCNVEGGAGGTGMIDADPLFVDADGPDNDPLTYLDNDYRLAPGSPSLDAGDSTLLSAEFPVDLDLNNRVVDDPAAPETGIAIFFQTVDQGAYERQAPPSGSGACNGADLDGDNDADVLDFSLWVQNFGCDEN